MPPKRNAHPSPPPRGYSSQELTCEHSGPYLTHVKRLVRQWPHLELLADFMDVGTTPVRWNPKLPGGFSADPRVRGEQRVMPLMRR